MRRPQQSIWMVTSWLLLAIASCNGQHIQKNILQATNPSVTILEAPQTVPVTQLEPPQPASATATTLTTSQPAQTTTTSVQQTLTALNAQKTSEGIRIDLPENILFDFDKSELRPTAKPTLTKLNSLLNYYRNAPVSIYGHTDGKGSNDYNRSLSQERANAVKTYFVRTFGIEGDRLEAKGFGESRPIAPNTKSDGSDDPQNRQKNRRVEVIIHSDDSSASGNSKPRRL